MHLALARKYRPQNFLEVLGQGPVVKTLQNAIENNRLHHAYLFSGVRGVGKTSMARILAKSINCEKGPTITPCQVCGPCVAITQGNSLDVMEIDGASHNSVENVRDLREQVKYLPTSGKYKIVIIDEVHMLTGPAFNALLKTLEEPPQHIIFIFATTEPHKLPVTILSRCQKYDFRKLNTTTLQAHLKNIAMNENVEISDEALRLVTQCAQGSVRDGVSLLDQVLSYQTADITADSVSEILGLGDRVLTQKMFTTIIKEELSSGLELLQQVDERGVDLKLFAEDLLLCFRHLILLESTGKVPPELSQAESEHLHSLAGQLDLSLLLAQYQILFKGIQELAHSEFPKTSFEISLVKLAQVKQMVGLTDLVNRITNRQTGSKPQTGVAGSTATATGKGRETHAVVASQTADAGQKGDWYALVKWITAQNPPLGSLLKDVVPVLYTKDRIEVATSGTSPIKGILLERVQVIGALIDQHFGHTVAFTISDLEGEKKKPPA